MWLSPMTRIASPPKSPFIVAASPWLIERVLRFELHDRVGDVAAPLVIPRRGQMLAVGGRPLARRREGGRVDELARRDALRQEIGHLLDPLGGLEVRRPGIAPDRANPDAGDVVGVDVRGQRM